MRNTSRPDAKPVACEAYLSGFHPARKGNLAVSVLWAHDRNEAAITSLRTGVLRPGAEPVACEAYLLGLHHPGEGI